MVHQTQIDRKQTGHVRRNLAGLAHDTLSLVELQGKLLAVDLREMRRGATGSVLLMVAGAVLALGCMPLLLLAAGEVLIEVSKWSTAAAYAVVGGAALAAAAVLVSIGWGILTRSLNTMERSRHELAETLRWLKDALRTTDDAPIDASDDWPSRRA